MEGMESGRREFEKSQSMLDSYLRAFMDMHPLMRIMALGIIRKTGERHIVEVSNKHVKELPTDEEWTTDLTKVILIDTAIKKITPDHSPKCPNLTIMLLCGNCNLVFIHDSFFQHLGGLQVLDLSCTGLQKLPNSVSNLVNLTSLLLRECRMFRDVPSLAKLETLRRLDIRNSGVENVPDGMKLLSNLNYLDISGTEIATIPDGILPNLSNLQFLGVDTLVKGEELGRLTNLETLMCTFIGISSFNTCMRSISMESQQVDKYLFVFGDAYKYEKDFERGAGYNCKYDRSVILYKCHHGYEGEDAIHLPTNIQRFEMWLSSIGKSLCLGSKSELKRLYIENCSGMEYLTRDVIFNGERLSPNSAFSHLEELCIYSCASIKNLFPACLLQHLRNLKEFRVQNCELLEEIVASDLQQCSLSTDAVIQFSLPKLEWLELDYLPQLKSICCNKLICNSLKKLFVVNCPKLDDIPLSLPILSFGKVDAYPEDLWQRVRWENPIDDDAIIDDGTSTDDDTSTDDE